jgi:hypothetical protein
MRYNHRCSSPIRLGSVELFIALGLLLLAGASQSAPSRRVSSRSQVQPIRRSAKPDKLPLTSLQLVETGGYRNPYVEYKIATMTLDGQTYTNAMKVQPSSTRSVWLEFSLGRHYSRFETVVGMSDAAPGGMSLVYTVIADGRELYRSRPLRVGSGPQRIVVDVTGILRLRLQAEAGEGWLIGETNSAYWINPVVYRGGTKPPPPTAARIILDGAQVTTMAPIVNGEPCVPLSVLQGLRGPIQNIEWDPGRNELTIETR